ncbi:MAG TPA: lysylphosphatidylglycerol synthase domain-containing protein [bacterium]|nr:lysylphosphatidylglycerol synthase domain-containing protein [bacterium]
MKAALQRIIGVALACIILLFIGRNLYLGLHAMGHYRFTVSPLRIVGAFATFAVLFPVYGWLWKYIMAKFGYPLTYGKATRIWLLSQAGRYIPGKVWFALGRIYLSEREGIPKRITTIATALELVLVLGSSLVIFGLAWLVRPSIGGHPYVWSVWLIPVMIVGVHPRILRWVLRWLGRFGKRGAAVADASYGDKAFTMKYTDVLTMLVAYVFCWCIYGIGYYLIASAIGFATDAAGAPASPDLKLLPEMIGINALAWAGGFLSVITPAGLGIREGISTFLLRGLVANPYPLLIPLVARVWVTISEVVAIGLAFVARGRK